MIAIRRSVILVAQLLALLLILLSTVAGALAIGCLTCPCWAMPLCC
jgi:hypothetical protein